MARTVSIGIQDFAKIRENNSFYVDKTSLIKEWWIKNDDVTLITRPRRFGKTLNMSMLNCFFSNKYANRSDLFEGLEIWKDETFHSLQGTYPVLFLSFADVKHTDYSTTRASLNAIIADLCRPYEKLLENEIFSDTDRNNFYAINRDMDDSVASRSLKQLCEWLSRYYGKKCIILLDEYDTPMQEAYVNGFWNELAAYTRALFNSTFKTNPYLERAIMIGITRVSKESIFSDLNNLNVVTTTSNEYATAFGFTEAEVFAAMDEQGITCNEQEYIRKWYDGFTFGQTTDIYNPWSITMYLDKKKFDAYWANTSANGLVGKIIRESDRQIKEDFEKLLNGESIEAVIDEQIIFDQLDGNRDAIWSLLLASGYLKVEKIIQECPEDNAVYVLRLTNFEVQKMFSRMISGWFAKDDSFGEFLSAMFAGDVRVMNHYMNRIALNTFSYFDAGSKPSEAAEPERFYHGFVLGLIVDKAKDYIVKSNRESGFGRYDVVMEPKNPSDVAIIMEFKVLDNYDGENELVDTAANALKQIEEKKYETDLLEKGVSAEKIYKYGFAFEGKKCLIAKA
ncbi:PD-(D/E)XK nuclease superfamily protein [Lachnospiraceae bacterium XBB1006]|nr:PD-(D/E)XK nuclease superfamily protein [Lachnospiraceae bacterium XBB1006]